MSLPINEDYRQHISLSTFAYNTIMSDLMTYDQTAANTDTLSGIANVIIQNYFDKSFASVSKNAENEKMELEALILSQNFQPGSKEEEVANTLRDSLVIKHRDDLAQKMNGFSKDNNVKIRLQKETVKLLENECSDDIVYYKKTLTGYLKALLEDYARQSKYVRESILFKKNIEKLELEIDRAELLGGKSRAIKLISLDYYHEKTEEYICKPYRITKENEVDDIPYLLCLAIDPKCPEDGFVEALLSIQEVVDIQYAPKSYGSSNLTKDNKKKMDQLVAEHNSYLFGRRKQNILVSMTESGLYDFYRKNTKERPALDVKKIRINGNHRFEAFFYCTQKQAYDYFLPFGSDAIVILPKELSDKMAEHHKSAHYLYNLHSEKQVFPRQNPEVDADIKRLQESEDSGTFKMTWNELAIKYFENTNSVENVEDEILFYQKAADLEYDVAYPILGDIYFENDFFKKDYKKAAHYYELAFDQLDSYRKANYASLIINNLVDGHSPEEGYKILEDLKDRYHKEHVPYTTTDGYTLYSYAYKKYDHAILCGYLNEYGEFLDEPDNEDEND